MFLQFVSIWTSLKFCSHNELNLQPFWFDQNESYQLNVFQMLKFVFNSLPDDKILDWSKFKQIAYGI